jgi:hypothetical protein
MVASMKSDRKNPLGNKGGANPRAPRNLTTKPDIARQYADLCRLRDKVHELSEKARRSRPKTKD